jgi:hypothetical protein
LSTSTGGLPPADWAGDGVGVAASQINPIASVNGVVIFHCLFLLTVSPDSVFITRLHHSKLRVNQRQ